jgi:hypothetical protein
MLLPCACFAGLNYSPCSPFKIWRPLCNFSDSQQFMELYWWPFAIFFSFTRGHCAILCNLHAPLMLASAFLVCQVTILCDKPVHWCSCGLTLSRQGVPIRDRLTGNYQLHITVVLYVPPVGRVVWLSINRTSDVARVQAK